MDLFWLLFFLTLNLTKLSQVRLQFHQVVSIAAVEGQLLNLTSMSCYYLMLAQSRGVIFFESFCTVAQDGGYQKLKVFHCGALATKEKFRTFFHWRK